MQLLEDLRFATATTKIKATPDGEYIIASGTLCRLIMIDLGIKFGKRLLNFLLDRDDMDYTSFRWKILMSI